MSHQTGIQADPDLIQAFSRIVHGHDAVRVMDIRIKEESLRVHQTRAVVGADWKQDFSLVANLLEPDEPCYLAFRLDKDSHASSNYTFLFLCYIPEQAKVREKMLYAATRATLTKALGDTLFVGSIFATTPQELTLEAYLKQQQQQAQPQQPYTAKEQALKDIKAAENGVDIGASTRKSYAAQSLAVPVQPKLDKLCAQQWQTKNNSAHQDGIVNCLSLYLETITSSSSVDLKSTSQAAVGHEFQLSIAPEQSSISLPVKQLPQLPISAPRYILVRYHHQGTTHHLFVYVCPPTAAVRDRMIYASSRATVLDYLQGVLETEISQKVEIDDPAELDEAFVRQSLLVDASAQPPPPPTTGFIRKTVKGPGSGPRRLHV